ncbi:subclass B3 metallo-beta-lactamase [Novosphingobium flavum]|uniref:Subclass B3 metallo-beta-lactamase n=1 Tax=Novosphingobium flavum TaxID=1778672 RepID=A0A7X1FSL2_9SPHN|nr:subclass B3 metallo-beta-lactamase [Novosphingobium flavum]MBC2666229.1 subclass B3 metallo-beta-lactamase [Novosphingobium flavum]
MILRRLALLAAAAALASPAPAQPSFAGFGPGGPDKAGFQRIAAQCKGKESFSDPSRPARIFGNVWYVGTCTVTVLLVTSPRGHVLIDAATHEAAPAILANIRALGFNPREVRWILTSHEHFDHVGGLADMVRATGARVIARAAAVPVLTSGKVDPADPQAQRIEGFAPVRVDRIVADAETVALPGLTFTASATTGHTAGSTSWTWRSCAGPVCRRFDYVDSISALALGTYRMSDHPALIARFRQTFAQVAARPCGVLLTPHPAASDMFARLSGLKPLAEPGACRAYAAAAEKRLNDLLESETRAGK